MNRAATIALAPLSLAYGLAVRIRGALYQNGVFKKHNIAIPIISVGNITLGGTGKTPLVEWIARHLAENQLRVCVLTRGYLRANPGERLLVSDGSRILCDVKQSGDEAMLLAESLLGKAAVLCDADRFAGARWAAEQLDADVLVLDDGFQHRRLARDLDIVIVDATNPFGNGWIFPAGILREPPTAIRRADCVVVTRYQAGVDEDLREQISEKTDAPVFLSKMGIQRFTAFDSKENPSSVGPLAAFCGIGNPDAFFQQLRDEGLDVRATKAFRDHHEYSQSDIDRLVQEAVRAGVPALVTTAKDAVKLRSLQFTLPCYVAEIQIEISQADKLLALIDEAIQTKRTRV